MGVQNLENSNHDQPDKDFLIVALDLLSELVETLREFVDPLISQSNLIQLVSYFN